LKIQPISAGFFESTPANLPSLTGKWGNNLPKTTTTEYFYPSGAYFCPRQVRLIILYFEKELTMTRPVILMVESDLPTIELYRGALNQEYEMLACDNETSALDILARGDVRAIILEPALGGGRGWGIFAAIRSAIRQCPVPVIVLTTLDDRKRGLEMGASAFLVKPVLPGVLLETLRQLQHFDSIE
jgi:PleD family two-component response regulator